MKWKQNKIFGEGSMKYVFGPQLLLWVLRYKIKIYKQIENKSLIIYALADYSYFYIIFIRSNMLNCPKIRCIFPLISAMYQ